MTGTPQVTIAIPTHRRPHLLRETLASAIAQTCEDVEIVVSANGPDDETEAVVSSFGDPRVEYSPLPENIGFVGNMTRCLRLGSAPFVTILHDDDLLAPTSVERRLERILGDPCLGVVNTAHSVIDTDGRVLHPTVNWSLADDDWELEGEDFIRRSLRSGVHFHPSTALLRRSLVSDERFEPVGGYTDLALWLRMASRGARLAYLHEPLTAVREHLASESTLQGLHAGQGSEAKGGQVTTETLEQVRQMQLVRRRFLEREGSSLPDRRRLWAAARRDARKRMARLIVKEALRTNSVSQTVGRLREAEKIERGMVISPWSLVALTVALGGAPAWRCISFLAAPAKRYWATVLTG